MEAELASRRLNDLGRSAGSAERASGGLMSAFARLAGPVALVTAGVAGLMKLTEVQRQFDVLNAGLITATGSAEKAGVAFEALQEFASKTPYSLDQAVEGFTKLVNLGLTPSEAALTSYGDTAAAMGKNLNQMIEAVADAATGEFERLKEFGIKAKQEGDQVSLTFQGVTTTVGRNAAEIEQYLIKLGEDKFAGAMENRMNSLDGALSNLADTWDNLFRTISAQGVGGVIEDSVRMATDVLQELIDMIASGQMEAYLDAIAGKFSGWGADIQQTISVLTQFYKDNLSQFESEGRATVDFLIGAFRDFPENVRAFIQLMTVEVAAGLDKVTAYSRSFKDGVKAIFSDDTFEGVGARLEAELAGISENRRSSIGDILDERDAALQSFDDQISKAKQLRLEYENRPKASIDDLGLGPKGGSTAPSGSSAGGDAAAKKRRQEYEQLVESLRSEEEALAASYERRKAIIEANTPDGSAARADLLARLDKDNADKLAQLKEQRDAEIQGLKEQLMTEEEAIAASYEKRMEIISSAKNLEASERSAMEGKVVEERDKALRDLENQRQSERDSLYNGLLTEQEMLAQAYENRRAQILDSESVTETERQDLLRRLKEQFDDETAESENRRIQSQLAMGEQLFGGLAGLAKAYGGEQSKAYRALYAVSKAFSVAQAALSISTGLAKAQELGYPANLAEMARVGATGASILSQINGSQFSGAYDQGGQIPAGKVGIVGEYGPELVRGPSSITGRVATERMMRETSGNTEAAPAPQVNFRNINVLDPALVGDFLGTDAGEQMIMNVVQRNRGSL